MAAADQATDLLQKLSLDPKSKASEAPEAKEKSPGAPVAPMSSVAVAPNPQVSAAAERAATPMMQDYKDSSMYYGAYPTPAYFYGGYGGWGDYSTYVSRDGAETPTPGAYGDMYYSYAPYSPYPSSSPVPTLGHDGQMYTSQHYQYPATYHQPQAPSKPACNGKTEKPTNLSQGEVSTSAADLPPVSIDASKVGSNGIDGVKGLKKTTLPLKPSQTSSVSNGSYARPGGRSSNYQNQGNRSAYPWFGGQIFSDRQQRLPSSNLTSTALNAKSKGQSKNPNPRPLPHLMGLHGPTSPMGPPTPGIMNSVYSGNGMYGHTGNAYRPGLWYGSPMYGSGPYGGWNALSDGKYKPRGRVNGSHGFSNENLDGLNELKRGPRSGLFKNQQAFGGTAAAPLRGQELPTNKASYAVVKDQYNRADFVETYVNAKFFIIKSYSEDDIHKSIKYNVWASTPNGNKKLDAAYQEAKERSDDCSVFLLFSVNTSGQFVGLAEMVGQVDFNKTVEYWQQDKWTGCFPVRWHIVKDVPNNLLKHIILENNENKPVTNSRDTQEVKLEQGLQMLKIFKDHVCKTSILDDFNFYDNREKVMQERKSKQQQPLKKVMDAKLLNAADTEKDMFNGNLRSQKLTEIDSILNKEPVHGKVGEQNVVKENGVMAAPVNGIAPKDAIPVMEKHIANGC